MDSKESILPAYVAWRAGIGTTNRDIVPASVANKLVNRFLGIDSWAPSTFTNSDSDKKKTHGGASCERTCCEGGVMVS
jgi:hypothetical protein